MLIHIRIYGRVQGVGFRAWTCRQGESLNLSGWVRNRINGSVEILADGPERKINEFLTLCRRGPLFGRVDRIEPISVPDAPVLPIIYGVFTSQATV